MTDFRPSKDPKARAWYTHLTWLLNRFSGEPFDLAQVSGAIRGGDAPAPPGVDALADAAAVTSQLLDAYNANHRWASDLEFNEQIYPTWLYLERHTGAEVRFYLTEGYRSEDEEAA